MIQRFIDDFVVISGGIGHELKAGNFGGGKIQKLGARSQENSGF